MLIRVIRAFRLNGETRVPGGDPLEVRDDIARELIASNKAERAAAAPPVSGPMTTESAPALTPGKAPAKAPAKSPKGE